MSQDGFDFLWVQALNQSVKKHNSFSLAHAREISVAMSAALTTVHDEKTLAGEVAALEQTFDAIFQGAIFERFKLIEEGCDEGWK